MQAVTPVDDRGARPVESAIPAGAQVTLFLCANSARGGLVPPGGVRLRPSPPPVQWPFSAQEIVLPCAGKIQPEHILKAFETGADLVCVIACEESNCHYLEGSPRARVRVEYVRLLLEEVGLGGQRLLLFHLPGSAKEDLALGCAAPARRGGNGQDAPPPEELAGRLKFIAAELAGRLKELGLSPLHGNGPPAAHGQDARAKA